MSEKTTSIDKLFGLEFSGVKFGLENIKTLLLKLGNPQDGLKFIHIGGTNGKGSVSAIISKVLVETGYNVGLFTSPHLASIRERFRFNNNGISKCDLDKYLDIVFKNTQELAKDGINITFFEATVAVALLYFKEKNCDFIVWEVGMGGRLDATSVVIPIVSIITTIALDHQQYLGDTLEKIAFEKAGIIKKGVDLFLGDITAEALNVIKNKAIENNSKVYYFENNKIKFEEEDGVFGSYFYLNENSKKYKLGLPGIYQQKNFTLAFTVLEYLSKKYDFDFLPALDILSNFSWPARMQKLPDGKILDGAHNIEGFTALVRSIKKIYPEKRFNIIFGCLKERNPKEPILLLSEIAERFFFVPIASQRGSFTTNDMLSFIEDNTILTKSVSCNSIEEAISLASSAPTIIVGSLYLAGEVLKLYYTEEEILKI